MGWGGCEEREVGVCDLMVKEENIQIQSSLLTITLFPLPVVKFNKKKTFNVVLTFESDHSTESF